jgi:hypothetical protein
VGDATYKGPVIITLRVFPSSGIKIPRKGTWVKLRGYETGEFSGVPHEAAKDIPNLETSEHTFENLFQVTKILETKLAEPQR